MQESNKKNIADCDAGSIKYDVIDVGDPESNACQ